MSLTVSSPVTGSAQTGFTSPTYTLVADVAPTSSGKQYAVSAIGGTQAGVDSSSSPSRPFTWLGSRPAVLKGLQPVDPVTGILKSVPRNVYSISVKKGVTPLAGQASVPASYRLDCSVPAGSDSADAPNLRAALSLLIGSLNQISSSLGDTLVTGII